MKWTVPNDAHQFCLSGEWHRDGNSLLLRNGEHEAIFAVIDKDRNEVIIQTQGLPSLETQVELSLVGLRFEKDGDSAERK